MYHYAANNPIKYTDTDGRSDCGATIKNDVLESYSETFSGDGYTAELNTSTVQHLTDMGNIDTSVSSLFISYKFENNDKGQKAGSILSSYINDQRENVINLTLVLGGALISFSGAGVLASTESVITKFCGGVGGATIGTLFGFVGLMDKINDIQIDAGDMVNIQLNTEQKYDGSQPTGSKTNTFILRIYDKDMNLKYEEKIEY